MTILAPLNRRLPTVAPRTRLYHLPPMGLGTPLVEGLAGYVMRLAEAHCVTTSALMADEVLPLLKPSGGPARPAATWLADHGPHFNGTGDRAQQAVAALTLLTSRRDLRALTLLPWAQVLAPHGLIRLRKPARVWCAACYADLLARGAPLYEPLLWSIAVVTVCPAHRIRLCDHCPHADCGRPLPALAAWARPGHCSWCRRPLFWPLSERPPRDSSVVESGWDLWVAQQLGALLAATDAPPLRARSGAGWATLDSFIHTRCGQEAGAYAQFARLVDLHVNNLCRWRKGRALPTIDVLLRACHHLRISLVDLLRGESAGLAPLGPALPPALPRRKRALPQSSDAEQLRQNVKALLAEDGGPPLSGAAAARQLGCTGAVLARLHPEAYQTITARYRTHRRQQHERRLALLAAEMRQIMTRLDAAGIYPAAKRVRPLLQRPVHPRNSHFNHLRHQLLLELGWTVGGSRLNGS